MVGDKQVWYRGKVNDLAITEAFKDEDNPDGPTGSINHRAQALW